MTKSYREDCLDRKRVREDIVEPRPVNGKSGKDKPVIVQFRWRKNEPFGRILKSTWRKAGSYRDMDTALATMGKQAAKHPYFEYRLKPEDEA